MALRDARKAHDGHGQHGVGARAFRGILLAGRHGVGALFRVVLDEFKERFRVLRRADAAQQAGRAHGQRHDLALLRGPRDHPPQARAGALVPHQRQRESVVVGVGFVCGDPRGQRVGDFGVRRKPRRHERQRGAVFLALCDGSGHTPAVKRHGLRERCAEGRYGIGQIDARIRPIGIDAQIADALIDARIQTAGFAQHIGQRAIVHIAHGNIAPDGQRAGVRGGLGQLFEIALHAQPAGQIVIHAEMLADGQQRVIALRDHRAEGDGHAVAVAVERADRHPVLQRVVLEGVIAVDIREILRREGIENRLIGALSPERVLERHALLGGDIALLAQAEHGRFHEHAAALLLPQTGRQRRGGQRHSSKRLLVRKAVHAPAEAVAALHGTLRLGAGDRLRKRHLRAVPPAPRRERAAGHADEPRAAGAVGGDARPYVVCAAMTGDAQPLGAMPAQPHAQNDRLIARVHARIKQRLVRDQRAHNAAVGIALGHARVLDAVALLPRAAGRAEIVVPHGADAALSARRDSLFDGDHAQSLPRGEYRQLRARRAQSRHEQIALGAECGERVDSGALIVL